MKEEDVVEVVLQLHSYITPHHVLPFEAETVLSLAAAKHPHWIVRWWQQGSAYEQSSHLCSELCNCKSLWKDGSMLAAP